MTRDEILALPLGRQAVHTQAWGTVYVRQLRGDELSELLTILDGPSGARRLAAFCVLGCVQDDGGPMFREGDAAVLASRALEPISEVASAFLEYNGIDGVTNPEAEKKSDSPPPSSSPTVSQIGGGSRIPN